MKKLFSFIAATLFVSSMMAEPVILDYSAKGYENNTPLDGVAVTEGDITVTITKGTGTTAPAYYAAGTGARTYGGNVLKVESAASPIIAVLFNLTQNNKDYTVDSGTYSKDDAMWTGSAQSVTFTTEAGSGHNRIKSIKVYFEGDPVDVPTDIEATVAEALIAGNALDSLASSEDTYIVTGYVVNSQPYNAQYGNQIWYMADDKDNTANQEFEAYACKVMEDNIVKQVIDGDKVKLTGKITKYYDNTAGKFIIEIKNGTAEFIEKADGDHDLPTIKVDTITVAEAIAEAQKLTPEQGKSASTTQSYAVVGYIAKIKDAYSSQYKNISFYMSDTATATRGDLQAYRCKLDSALASKAVEGAYVMVTGPITNYNGGTYNSYEIAQGTVEILSSVEIDTITVADALDLGQALADNTTTGKPYHVKGYVVKAFDYDQDAHYQNFYMADEAGAFGDFYAYRAKPESALNEGDLIVLTGRIKKYVSQDGSKTTIEIEYGDVDVVAAAQGIENIVLTEKVQKVMVDGVLYIVRDNKLYDVRGTQVR